MGLANTMVYSTLPDFRERLNCTVGDLSTALSFGALGTFAAIPFSILSDKYTQYANVIVSLSLFIAAASNITRAYGKTIVIFKLCEVFDESAWAMIANVANNVILMMWGSKSQSPMLAAHLGYPIGATVRAEIASLFVSKRSHTAHSSRTGETTSTNISYGNVSFFNSSFTGDTMYGASGQSRIEISFVIAGSYLSLVALLFLFLQCCKTNHTQMGQQMEEVYHWKDIVRPSKWSNKGIAFGIKIFLLFIVFQIFLTGSFVSMGPFLSLYAVDSHLKIGPPEAARLVAITTLCQGLSSFVCAICFTRCLAVKSMLMIEVHGLVIASGGALVLGIKYKVGLYVFVSLFYIFMGPSYATILSCVDHYITPLCTLLAVVRLFRNMSFIIFLRFQGYLYDHVNIESIFYTALGHTCCMCLCVYGLYCVTLGKPFRYMTIERKTSNAGQEKPSTPIVESEFN